MRREYEIERDLNRCEKEYLNTKVLSIIGLSTLCLLSTLFYLFVFNKGNMFDIVVSSVVVVFFLILSIYNLYKHKGLCKTKTTLEREYKIATETPEERLQRTRYEKLSRVVEDEK